MKNTLQKLQAKRAGIVSRLAEIDEAIKAENKKIKEAQQREALAILHKSGILNDPARLRELLEKTGGADADRGAANA